jgi:hypothetical protein
MTDDVRLKGLAVQLRAIADLIDADMMVDVAYVAVPVEGMSLQGLAVPPKRPDELRGRLYEVAAWAGNTEVNAAIQAAQEELARLSGNPEVAHA